MSKRYSLIVFLAVTAICITAGISLWTGESPDRTREGVLTRIEIVRENISLGMVKIKTPAKATFQIRNTGEAPLIIKAVEPSCGCTRVKWNRHPVKPGETADISITFESVDPGKFDKSVTVFCNTPAEAHTLKFNGTVKG